MQVSDRRRLHSCGFWLRASLQGWSCVFPVACWCHIPAENKPRVFPVDGSASAPVCSCNHTRTDKNSLTAPLSSRQSHPQHSHYVSWLSTAADITFPQLPVWWVTVLWKHRVAANQQCAEMWCPSSSMRENPQYELSALHSHFRTVYSSFGIWSRSSYYLLHPGKKMCIQLEKHLKMKRLEISRRAGGEENTSAVFSEYDKNNTR